MMESTTTHKTTRLFRGSLSWKTEAIMQNDRERVPGGARVVDLFAGAGGLSLGFEAAGFSLEAAYDNWLPALSCYAANFDHPVHELDLCDVDLATEEVSVYSPDVVIGGPPCQDFSSAGKRREGMRASLTEAFINIAVSCSAEIIVMENVPRSRSSETYIRAREILTTHGYNLFESVLDASLCGVPQRRKRFFSIAWLSDNGRKDAKCLQDYFSEALSQESLTVADYMGDEIDFIHYYRHPRNYSRRGVYSIFEPSATIRGVNRPVPPSYPGHPLDAAPASDVRPLTAQERSRIQTFPPDWSWEEGGAKTTVEQLIGNAVPVELGRFVAEGISEALL